MSKNLAQQRREEIIKAAHKCFIAKGFHATGMADIAREFGMSAGHIYNYFPSKTAIIEEVISRGMEDFYKNSCALRKIRVATRRLFSKSDEYLAIVSDEKESFCHLSFLRRPLAIPNWKKFFRKPMLRLVLI